jgi:hypothetical protein
MKRFLLFSIDIEIPDSSMSIPITKAIKKNGGSLIYHHHYKKIVFLAGPKENNESQRTSKGIFPSLDSGY